MMPTMAPVDPVEDTQEDYIGWYLRRAGTRFDAAPLTPAEERVARAALGTRRVFRLKQCFHNAQRIVLADKTKTLQYVEGHRTEAHIPLPTLHAWAVVNGKVIDPTPSITRADIEETANLLELGILPVAKGLTLGIFAEGTTYVGVALPRRVFMRRRGDTTLDDWEHGFPLISAYEKEAGCSYEAELRIEPPPTKATPPSPPPAERRSR